MHAHARRALRDLAIDRATYRLTMRERYEAERRGGGSHPLPRVQDVLERYTFHALPGTADALRMAVCGDGARFVVTVDMLGWSCETPEGYEHWGETIICAVQARVEANAERRRKAA